MKVTIAVVQFEILHRKPEKNFTKVETFLKQAVKNGAQVIVFPELFLTGPIGAHDTFIDFNASHRQRLQQLAHQYKIDLVTGSIIEGDSKGLHNTTYYINSQGVVLGKYNKINLWLPERKRLVAGSETSVFSTVYGKVGLCICWDLVSAELFRKMVKQGVEIVFCPSYWCSQLYGNEVKHDLLSEIKHVDALCITRAFEWEIVLVYCNAAGKCEQSPEKYPKELIGHSQITIPFKGALQCFRHNKEGMIIQTVDTAILQDAEALYRIRETLDRTKE